MFGFGNNESFDIAELLGIDKETAKGFINVLFDFFNDVKAIRFLMEREFGIIPDESDWEEMRKDLEEDEGQARSYESVLIIDEMEIEEPKSYKVNSRVGRKGKTGHIKNTGDNNLQLRWKMSKNEEYLNWYTMEPGEILEFFDDRIYQIEFKPVDDKAKLKGIIK